MVDAYRGQYEKMIAEQRATINELSKENIALQKENEYFKQREKLIITTLERAEQNANELNEKSKIQYSLEMQKLKEFMDKLTAYFDDLLEKYPHYPAISNAVKVKDLIMQSDDAEKTAEEIEKVIGKDSEIFNPKQKIGEYIAATEGGFNLNEVLNPGKLELEDLCKELGLIEENE